MVVGCVHSTFRRVERIADWLTGRAGPYFVGIGFALLLIGGASFFVVMLPVRVPAPAPLASLFDTHSPLHVLLGIVPTFYACFRRPYAGDMLLWLSSYGACAYILFMIAWSYIMACVEPAGNPVLGLGDNLKERRLGPGSGIWWARFRERAALASGPPLRRQTSPPPTTTSGPTFGTHLYQEPPPPAPTLPAAPVLVRPTPIYPDTSGDAFDLELDSEDLFPLPAKMCTKCKPVPLYVAIASLPPEMRKVEKMLRVGARVSELEQLRRGSGGGGGGKQRNGTETPEGHRPGKGGKRGKNKGRNRGRNGTSGSQSPLPGVLAAIDHDGADVDDDDGAIASSSGTRLENPLAPGGPASAEYLPHFALQETNEEDDEGEAEVRAWLGEEEAMQLVPPPKPERSHHCSVCKTCVVKYDHHCPWINACVGLGNERYFVLFLFWLSVGCATVVGTGYPLLPHVVRGWKAAFAGTRRDAGAKFRPFSADNDGPAFRSYTGLNYKPPVDDRLETFWGGFSSINNNVLSAGDLDFSVWTRVFVLLSLLVCALMGFAVFIMMVWQLVMVGRGETTVESHDNGYYRKLAKRRGQQFVNVYDVGFFRNIQLFFSLGPGSPHSFITVFLPLRIPPYSNGWHWAKRRGLGGRHAGIVPVEELTDDEGEADGGLGASPAGPRRAADVTGGGGGASALNIGGASPSSPVVAALDEVVLKRVETVPVR
ncbi:hypothetical protein V8E36_002322 [Tilletia maclaganii]